MDDPPKIWGSDNPIRKWTPDLLKIKNQIESLTGKTYNICLCNFYQNGNSTKAISYRYGIVIMKRKVL